ncbi:MAG TPA: recombination protein O N-terminal domain-containing protein [Candidatus Paceibacterota bacterium]
MSERIYTTRALVLSERASGEASKVFTLFTRELGLVYAYARSVREVRSKLRYNLPLYSHTLVSLVPGREYWRLVGAENSERGISAELCRFICRFMGEHEPHVDIFDMLTVGVTGQDGNERELKLNILDKLGYVGVRAESDKHREQLIEQGIYASHL